jgi:hypothetical protein
MPRKKTESLPAITERTWYVYRCSFEECDNFGGHWPVADNEESIERRCTECGMPGRRVSEHVNGVTRILEDQPEPSAEKSQAK